MYGHSSAQAWQEGTTRLAIVSAATVRSVRNQQQSSLCYNVHLYGHSRRPQLYTERLNKGSVHLLSVHRYVHYVTQQLICTGANTFFMTLLQCCSDASLCTLSALLTNMLLWCVRQSHTQCLV